MEELLTTIYLLIRMEGKMDKLTESIRSLSQALERLIRELLRGRKFKKRGGEEP